MCGPYALNSDTTLSLRLVEPSKTHPKNTQPKLVRANLRRTKAEGLDKAAQSSTNPQQSVRSFASIVGVFCKLS